MGRLVVLASIAKKASACSRQADGIDVVLQGTVLHVWKSVEAQ